MEHLSPGAVALLKFLGGVLAIIVTICLGALCAAATVAVCGKITGAEWPVAGPHCPGCGAELRRIEVQRVYKPLPREAKWVCAGTFCGERGSLFCDKEGDLKPLPTKTEAVPEN